MADRADGATSSFPPRDHLSAEQLADLGEGLLAPADEVTARTHLEHCATCRADARALADVTALLAASAAVSMPPEVAARLDAAVAAEAQQRAASAAPPATARSVSAAPAAVGSLAMARARRDGSARLRRAAAALVGVAAVLGGGFVLGDALLSSGGNDADTMAESAAGGAVTDSGSSDSGSSDSDTGGSDTGGSDTGGSDTGGSDPGAPEDTAARAPTVASDGTYTSAGLDAEATELLERVTAAGDDSDGPSPDESGREQGPTTAGVLTGTDRCVDQVRSQTEDPGRALAVDVGTFDGTPAVVVVLSLPADSKAAAEAWVVGAGCLDGDPPQLTVLDRALLPDAARAE